MRTSLKVVIGVLAVAGGVAGIVNAIKGNHVDTHDADAKLKAWAENEIGPVDKVTCPEAKLKKGNTFDCAADFPGGKSYKIHVVVTSDSGMVEYSWATPIAGGEKLASTITSAIKTQQGKDVTLDCGKGIREIPTAGLVCDITAGGQHGHLRVKYDTNVHQVVWAVEP